jgi:dTDP-4-dehydrorhamnose 3,5-epimerase-like enzyme
MNSILNFQMNQDDRGDLGVINFNELPFYPKRFFWIFNTPTNVERAGHAHKQCEQILFTLSGSVLIRIVDSKNFEHFQTINTSHGFYLKTKTWLEIKKFSENAVLGVFASHEYDRNEYIDTFEDFLNIIHS